ncbi:hypothetical protein GFS60_07680 (plasmid) [Rhodococcus sp. WAY2]|nr:hypothetical protein GFS60_07680 [Rhodococcus sp. WAY2]
MGATNFAARLLEPIPANASFGLFVLRAVAGTAEVGLAVTAQHTNVIGSLHSSGLVLWARATTLNPSASALSPATGPSWCESVRTKSANACASAASLFAPETPLRSRRRAACNGSGIGCRH